MRKMINILLSIIFCAITIDLYSINFTVINASDSALDFTVTNQTTHETVDINLGINIALNEIPAPAINPPFKADLRISTSPTDIIRMVARRGEAIQISKTFTGDELTKVRIINIHGNTIGTIERTNENR